MSKPDCLSRIVIARSTKSLRTSQDAYAQVDRMAKSTSGQFTTKVSVASSLANLTFLEKPPMPRRSSA